MAGIQVYTQYRCSRCGKSQAVDGAQTDLAPSWTSLDMKHFSQFRDMETRSYLYCQQCWFDLDKFHREGSK